jgi:hypothetical protein
MNPNTKKMLLILVAIIAIGVILNFAGGSLLAELKHMHGMK